MMNLLPQHFVELVGGTLATLAAVFLVLSLIPALRVHTTRGFAILFVASLAMFSNHWSTYFAALFIIATAVTELEFLQNLAAIIRGNKDYFQYKKETLNKEQIEEKIVKEQAKLSHKKQQTEALPSSNVRFSLKESSSIMQFYKLEQAALDFLEKHFEEKIERNVRIKSKDRTVELDGLIPSVVDDMVSEKIIEVKIVTSNQGIDNILSNLPMIENIAERYIKITGKVANIHLAIVIADGEVEVTNQQYEKLKIKCDRSKYISGFSIINRSDLDVEKIT